MRRGNNLEGAASVGGTAQLVVGNINRIGQKRVGVDAVKIKCALPEAALVVDQGPGGAAIVGAKQTAILRFDECKEAVRISRNRNRNLSNDAARNAGIVG